MMKTAIAWMIVGVCVLMGGSTAHAAELKVLIWSDYIDPELVKAFEGKTSSTVKIEVYEETEAMLGKLQAGAAKSGDYDVVVVSDHAVPVLVKLGLVRKLDGGAIPNTANLEERFARPPYDPAGEYSRPYQWGTVGVMFNKKKVSAEAASSWGVFFDSAKRKGGLGGVKFLMLDSPRDTLGAALKFGGGHVNEKDAKAVQGAGRAVLEAKKDAGCVGFEGSVAAAKRVVSGQADVAMVYNGDALNAIKDSKSADFDYVVPKEGSIIWVDTMVITAGSKNVGLAHQFINFILDGENGAKLSNFINYATPNRKSLEGVDETARKDVRIYPSAEQMKGLEYLEDVGEATRVYDSVWTAVKAR